MIVAALCNKFMSGKAFLTLKNSYLPTFDNYFLILSFVLPDFVNIHFSNNYFLNGNVLSDDKVLSSLNEYGSLV